MRYGKQLIDLEWPKRHLKRRLRLRSLGEANAFVGGGERVCEEKRTRSHAEANAFELGDEHIRKRRRTRSNSETNAFTSGGERVRTRRRTRLHANANARSLYLASERYCMWVRNLLYLLVYQDQKVVKSRGGWLTDQVISAAQMIMLQHLLSSQIALTVGF